VQRIGDNIWAHRIWAEGFVAASVVVFTSSRVFVIDTLTQPHDMEPVVDLVAERGGGRRVVVVNSHHHWDHVYGNAAFPGADIVAQRACPRLITAQTLSRSETVPLPPAEGVPLPSITFGDRLLYSDDEESVHLLHSPGHTEDSLVVYLERARLLVAGDTVEWPLPGLCLRDGLDTWVGTLRRLKQLPVEYVVPAHGPTMDKALIDANEYYLTGLYEAVAAAKAAGVGRSELDVPASRFLPEDEELNETYLHAHAANLAFAWDEV
jgi:glyoxylase-like metal-dependent hydrolase (beta-lactamase superfamily II)